MVSETRDVYMRCPKRCLRWSFGFSIPSGSDVSTAPKRTTKTAPEAYGVGKEPRCLDEPFGHPHAEMSVSRREFRERRQRSGVEVVLGFLDPDQIGIRFGEKRGHQSEHAERAAGNAHLVHCVLKPRFSLDKIETIIGLAGFDCRRQPKNVPGCVDDRLEDIRRSLFEIVKGFPQVSTVRIEPAGIEPGPIAAEQERIGIEESPPLDEIGHMARRERGVRRSGSEGTHACAMLEDNPLAPLSRPPPALPFAGVEQLDWRLLPAQSVDAFLDVEFVAVAN